jgi:4-hydroxy-tetrahydrodipicolinate synthase
MTTTTAPFGRLMTAMITPMTSDGAVDYDGAARLAAYLVDEMRSEGLVVNGTTGEAPTTTDEEKARLVKVVREAVGDRATVVAGVGTNITAHSVELARQAEKAGAHGLLVVTPYYNKPAQDALAAHFTAIADATGLPAIIYDIPSRTGTAVASDTLIRLAEHPRIVAVKDAKGDLAASSHVLAHTDLAYYSGDDPMNLPLWSVGGVGCISVTGHVVGDRIFAMLEAFTSGRNAEAGELHRSMLPVNVGLFRNQAAVLTKAALELLGQPGGGVRGPLLPASDAERRRLVDDLIAGGVKLNHFHSDNPGLSELQRDSRNGNGSKENIANGAAL